MKTFSSRHEYPMFEMRTRVNGNDSLLILFATVTGNAERIAHRLAHEIQGCGFTARVMDMARCAPQILTEHRTVLIVASTCGNGEPPDNAASFWEAVVHGNGLDLRGLQFSVLALGNSTYDHFCRCGRELDAALERHGATRLYPRVDCDADYDLPAKRWTQSIIESLQCQKITALRQELKENGQNSEPQYETAAGNTGPTSGYRNIFVGARAMPGSSSN